MRTYRAGVIGHTHRGNYGHGLDTVYRDVPDAEVVAVADADEGGRVSAGERLEIPEAGRYADYHEMLDKEELDVVSIAMRYPGQHEEMVTVAAESGVKGIFCEKPFAQTLQQGDTMLAACDGKGVKTAIAFQLRVHPFIQQAQRLISDGFIGEVRQMHGIGKQDARGGGQDLIVLGTHILDLMRLFCGDPLWVEATVMQGDHLAEAGDAIEGNEEVGPILGDNLIAIYAFENGVIGTFRSRVDGDPSGKRSMGLHIEGTEGILAYRGGCLMHHRKPCWTPAETDPAWHVLRDASDFSGLHPLNAVIVSDLISAIEHDREAVVSCRDGLKSLEMILGVYAAHRTGRAAFPMADREHPLRDWVAQ